MDLAHDRHAVVSSESDMLILVNDQDEYIGSADKAECHDGEGILHRAFSVILFNSKGEVLIQKRASGKRLWGDYWSNSCCSHPRDGETMEQASERRVWEELGLKVDLTYLYKFQYFAPFGNKGSERELCWVYIGKCDTPPSTNENEISECRYLSKVALEKELEEFPNTFTPWFKIEWQEIWQAHKETLDQLLK